MYMLVSCQQNAEQNRGIEIENAVQAKYLGTGNSSKLDSQGN
jgi:hypothetical protein